MATFIFLYNSSIVLRHLIINEKETKSKTLYPDVYANSFLHYEDSIFYINNQNCKYNYIALGEILHCIKATHTWTGLNIHEYICCIDKFQLDTQLLLLDFKFKNTETEES